MIIIVSILALFCVWTKSLMCKWCGKWGFHFSEWSKKNYKVPCQPSGRCVIPSGRPSVYCSIRSDDVSFRPDIRQTSIICPDNVLLPSRHLHRIEKLLCQLDPSGRFSSTSGRLSVLERFTDSFQVQEREDQSTVRTMWYPVRTRISVRQESQFKMNRPDIWQLWSGRWFIVYGNCRFDFNRPDVSPSWSGRTRIKYGNCVF
jgi:hypothetical protein